MANVLLIDSSDVARKALKGVLARGGHRLAWVDTPADAWDAIRKHVKIDLVITDLLPHPDCAPDAAIEFVRRLKKDPYLKVLPVVIYTTTADRAAVKAAIGLGVQNFMVKPYQDEAVLAEMAKAKANPWRQLLFEEEKSFCRMTGMSQEDLQKALDRLGCSLAAAVAPLTERAEARDGLGAEKRLTELNDAAEASGAWGVVECIKGLLGQAEERVWAEFIGLLPGLEFGSRLIRTHLSPATLPDLFLSDDEKNAEAEAKERSRWFDANAQGRLPVVQSVEAFRRVEALSGCPVVDSAAAMFRMLATGHPSSLIPIMEKAEMDPGLATQLLIAANRARPQAEKEEPPVDDIRLAIELLGELKLASASKGLVTLEERLLHALPFTWPRFWMFQVAVAKMSRQTCVYLEFHGMESHAYVGGLLHDLGKLLIAHLYPFGWQAIMAHARDHNMTTAKAERLYIGCTARELADRFAKAQKVPDIYRHVMVSLESPEEAEGDKELVAIVALARDVCRRNRVGHDGDQLREPIPPLEDTPAWRVLGPKVFPSFKWEAFQAHMHSSCQEVKRDLHGWMDAPMT